MEIRKNSDQINQILIENFVNLQKTMTNMAEKFDGLSGNIAKLLQLFEISARSFMDKQPVPDVEKDKEFLNKLNMLIDQNKTIAKGLTLMEGKIRERLYGEEEQNTPQPPLMPPRMTAMNNSPDIESRLDKFKKLPKI